MGDMFIYVIPMNQKRPLVFTQVSSLGDVKGGIRCQARGRVFKLFGWNICSRGGLPNNPRLHKRASRTASLNRPLVLCGSPCIMSCSYSNSIAGGSRYPTITVGKVLPRNQSIKVLSATHFPTSRCGSLRPFFCCTPLHFFPRSPHQNLGLVMRPISRYLRASFARTASVK